MVTNEFCCLQENQPYMTHGRLKWIEIYLDNNLNCCLLFLKCQFLDHRVSNWSWEIPGELERSYAIVLREFVLWTQWFTSKKSNLCLILSFKMLKLFITIKNRLTIYNDQRSSNQPSRIKKLPKKTFELLRMRDLVCCCKPKPNLSRLKSKLK